jgi:hypothetical protein
MTIDVHGKLWLMYIDNATGEFAVDEFVPGSFAPTPGAYSSPVPALSADLQLAPTFVPRGFAVDSVGDVFIANAAFGASNSTLYGFAAPLANNAPVAATQVYSGYSLTQALAVDATNKIFTAQSPPQISTATFTGSSFTAGSPVTGSAIVEPVAIANDGAGNIFETDANGQTRLNAIAGGSVTKTAVLAFGAAGAFAHDATSDYTYILTDNGGYALNVYAPFTQEPTEITVDANYVYISSANNVTLYPKYNPLKPYAAWRAYKPLSRNVTTGKMRR